MTARSTAAAACRFELERAYRGGLAVAAIGLVAFVAIVLVFTLGPTLFPAMMSMREWLVSVVPTVWYWGILPLASTVVAAQIGAADIASGSIRLVLSTPSARSGIAGGKLGALALMLLLMHFTIFGIDLLGILFNEMRGELDAPLTAVFRLAQRLGTGFFASAVWPILVLNLAVLLRSPARATTVSLLLIVGGWIARGQLGSATENYLVPFWGAVMFEHPARMVAPTIVLLAAMIAGQYWAMRRLEVR